MSASPDDASIQRLLFRAGMAVIAVLLGLAVFALQRDADDPFSSNDVGADAFDRPEIGPLPGTDLATYVEQRRAALAAMPPEGKVMAVVSFRGYLTESEARTRVSGVTVDGLLVAAPGGTPTLAEDLDAWASTEQEDARAERESLAKILPTVDQPDFREEYQREIARLDELLRRVDPKSDVVFGFVVEGDAAALIRLAGNADVRLVDVVQRGTVAAREDIRGIRPEETVSAGAPPTRPV